MAALCGGRRRDARAVNPAIEDRLRAHVLAILARAGVPAYARDDLEEELLGHLVERWQAHVADGLDEATATDRAIADFGTPGRLGRELAQTYHSRLWASTIGVLLPAIAPAASRPTLIGWLRFVVGLAVALTALGLAIALPTLTPARALASGASLAIGLTGLVLAFQALGRGQRWALRYAVGVTSLLLVEGTIQMVAPERPGSVVVPVGSIVAAGVLLAVLRNWQELRAFVAASPRLNHALGVALAISLFAPAIVPRALAALPDPTQATAADLELRLSLMCDRGDVELLNGPTLVGVQRATLVTDMTWSHTDVLPYGLAGVFTTSQYGDTSGLRQVDSRGATVWFWDWAGEPSIVDTQTGTVAGYWGSTSPSVALLPADTAGSFTIGIDQSAIQPSQTIRAIWLLYGAREGVVPRPRIEVYYAHLDRFLLAGTVRCGETVLGRPVPFPVDEVREVDPEVPF